MLLLLIASLGLNARAQNADLPRWKKQAGNVTIIRDEYGVPHIYGKTDADCVFGLLYAQCEEDFKRVEDNYITMLGRTAEVKGKSELYEDLLTRLTIDSAGARADYAASPDWLKKILQAYADGINYYLHTHPEVRPALIHHFEPWFPLMYTDGSISAIQTGGITASDIKAFYEGKSIAHVPNQKHLGEEKLIGSNGFAISPSKSKSGKALFFINPHVTFYFRPEVHMQSEEGLHVYGAVTWGQPFVYQGFNEFCGFMHTSSEADAADLYSLKVSKNSDGYYYPYDGQQKKLTEKKITVRYLENGQIKSKTFTTYETHHGPVVAMQDGKWISLKTMNRSLAGLIQSWQRTKATSFADFKKNLDLRANLSNNTVYADKSGNIAYWHGNYMPRRDPSYNWSKPVDGSTSKTEWKGMHTVDELVKSINPKNGWITNTNNTPFTVSGNQSPKKSAYPSYMAPDGENFRGLNAVRLFSQSGKMDLDDLIRLGYDTKLSAFDSSMPVLISKHQQIRNSHPALYQKLEEPIQLLKQWDHYTHKTSVATTLAIHWAEKMNVLFRTDDPELFADFVTKYGEVLRKTDPLQMLQPLADVIDTLQTHFGNWRMPWGEINRMQRIQNSLTAYHRDDAASIPVGRASSVWGQLPSFNSRTVAGSKKRYGYGGNSFVCAVEFGDRIRARSILAGGQSGDPSSPHFFDQGRMYADVQFKDVHFYKEDVLKHAKQQYHPGEEKQQQLHAHLPLIDSLISRYARQANIPGFAYGIVADGKLIHSRYHGSANLKEQVRVDSLTAFRIASMTKSFTTMAILILRDQGKLRLDDPAHLYIPQMKHNQLLTKDAPAITIRDLMTHRAGFPEDNPFGDRQMGNTDAQLEKLMADGPSFSNVPGITYEYSNLGISLLGLVIRNVSGMPYQQFIAQNIFKPLGMKNTYWEYDSVPKKQLAHGYRWINNRWEEQELEHDGSWGAMGGLITTIEDFARYMQVHLDAWPPRNETESGPATRSSLREMHQAWNADYLNPNFRFPSGKACPTISSYGYGLGILQDCAQRIFIGHGGGLPGFGSHWRILPQYGIGIAIFSNRTYAGWGGITLQTLDTLVALTKREPYTPAAAPILEKRKDQLMRLLPNWENAETSGIFAENFFPDNSIDLLKEQAIQKWKSIGTIQYISAIRPLNALRGTFDVVGEKGRISVFLTLSPETEAKIQLVEIRN